MNGSAVRGEGRCARGEQTFSMEVRDWRLVQGEVVFLIGGNQPDLRDRDLLASPSLLVLDHEDLHQKAGSVQDKRDRRTGGGQLRQGGERGETRRWH